MEVVLERPVVVVKEERRVESLGPEGGGDQIGKFGGEKSIWDGGSYESSSPDHGKNSTSNKQVSAAIASQRSSMDTTSRPSSSNPKSSTTISQEDQLESTKAEMGEVKEENERLKTLLTRVVKDYQSLQTHFFDIVQQEQSKKPTEITTSVPRDIDEPEFVSLSLGTSSSGHKKEEAIKATTNKSKDNNDQIEEGLTLGLDCKFEGSSTNGRSEPVSNLSPDNNSIEELHEEEPGEPWPPSKMLKTSRSGDEEVPQQTHVKKARVSVRARCDAPTMNDGCQWRKYGQKISKGNPCPRAYYRCTVAPACPVRKQVQRCAEDMSILITTYEGNHNHPLPISATAMASTTSAAAYMLMSGSSTSQPAIGSSATASSSPAAAISLANPNLHGLNFGLSDNPRPVRPPFYLPNPTISSTPSYPTITLDLTAPPPQSTTQLPSQFSRFSSNFASPLRYSSTNFNFSSSTESNTMPNWSNAYLNYAAQPYNKSQIESSNLGRQSHQDPIYQSYLQKATNPTPANPNQHNLTDTIAKAITSDPSFQSALAAAITSYVGGADGAQGGGEGHGRKWGEHSNLAPPPYMTTPAGNGCASSFLTRTSTSVSKPQQGSLMFLQPPLAFSSSKSASASPVDNRENMQLN